MSTLFDDVAIANFDYLSFNDKEFLGCGGEGDVYKAYSKELHRTVALKRCGRSFQENNLKEAKFLIKLSNSDNIVRMHGLLLENSRIVGYLMEYMELGSLHDAIHSKGKFKENRLVYGTNTILLWMHHAACGIKTLHDADIIHRDIKPQNILLGNGVYDVKISDFGLARDITASTLKTWPCGTKVYMAPEIIKDERFKKAGDIFAFAITCWEMIERRVPHEHVISDKDLINRRPEFESDGYVKIILQDLIEKGWSRDPNSRPSIEKFVETARRYTSLKNTIVHPYRRDRCLMDFFSKMEYSDFHKEMVIFERYLANHRSNYLQNSHLYKKGNFFRNIVDKIKNNNYHDYELWTKCSMHIFAPPNFSKRNRLLLEQEIRNRRKDFLDDSELLLISVEGGDCFIVIGSYSQELDSFMRQCEEILKMPYPGRGTTSFPTVKDQRQLYPVPARNILFIGDVWQLESITKLVSVTHKATVMVDGERFNFMHWGDNVDTLEILKNVEFHLICIMEQTDGQDDNSHLKFDRHFEQFRGYCNSKANIALLEFTTDETKYKLLQDDLSHVGLRLTITETNVHTNDKSHPLYNLGGIGNYANTSENIVTFLINGTQEPLEHKNKQDTEERRKDIMKERTVVMSLINAARNAPVCCFE